MIVQPEHLCQEDEKMELLLNVYKFGAEKKIKFCHKLFTRFWQYKSNADDF